LGEFRRVLAPEGFALITLPDVETIAAFVTGSGLGAPAYMSMLGPITPLDMLYGFGPALARGNHFMAHRCGFTGQTLLAALSQAGFGYSIVQRNPSAFSLWAIAFAQEPPEHVAESAKYRMLPLHMAMMGQSTPDSHPL
jgi:hypothetical protein